MNELIISEAWFTQLIDDCQSIITEKLFAARWEVIEGWHGVGKRILQEEENFTKGGYTLDGITLGRQQRSIQLAIQFAKAYPDLNALPEGKDVSWHKIVNKYLPKPSEKQKNAFRLCEEYVLCVKCGSEIMPLKLKCEHCNVEFEVTKEDIRRR